MKITTWTEEIFLYYTKYNLATKTHIFFPFWEKKRAWFDNEQILNKSYQNLPMPLNSENFIRNLVFWL